MSGKPPRGRGALAAPGSDPDRALGLGVEGRDRGAHMHLRDARRQQLVLDQRVTRSARRERRGTEAREAFVVDDPGALQRVEGLVGCPRCDASGPESGEKGRTRPIAMDERLGGGVPRLRPAELAAQFSQVTAAELRLPSEADPDGDLERDPPPGGAVELYDDL
jgi:hypothetical protein